MIEITEELRSKFDKWRFDNDFPFRNEVIKIYSHFKETDKLYIMEMKNGFILSISRPFFMDIEGFNTTTIQELFKKQAVVIENINSESEHILKLMKANQRLIDKNNDLRKVFREKFRTEIGSDDFKSELFEALSKINFNFKKKDLVQTIESQNKVGILQLSDLHFNELIDLPNNKYNFDIASRRLKFFIQKAIKTLKSQHITELHVALTGDIITSDRRADEKLNLETTKAEATALAIRLLLQVLDELSDWFNITIISVVGNESRNTEEMGYSNKILSDSADYLIFSILKIVLEEKGIKFESGDLYEQVFNIGSSEILLTHGYQIPTSNIDKKMLEIYGKWASTGVILDYIIFGDKHNCCISDKFSRSSSMCGSNAFSDSHLGFSSRASQNIYVIYDNKHINGIKIDLQNVDDSYEGYDIGSRIDNEKVGI